LDIIEESRVTFGAKVARSFFPGTESNHSRKILSKEALLYPATFLFCWGLSRNPFFAALLATVISVTLCCLASVFQ
jgi:hypothetical protein